LDALLGANHSNSGAIARICNAAERQNPQFQRREELFSVSLDFLFSHLQLTEEEQQEFAQRYPEEKELMTTWSQQLLIQGRQEGEATVLLRQLTRRFGPLGAATTEKIRQASSTELEQWADQILDATNLEDVFRTHE